MSLRRAQNIYPTKQKIEKDYDSYALTTIITHSKLKNNIAYQNFTKKGPLAFGDSLYAIPQDFPLILNDISCLSHDR